MNKEDKAHNLYRNVFESRYDPNEFKPFKQFLRKKGYFMFSKISMEEFENLIEEYFQSNQGKISEQKKIKQLLSRFSDLPDDPNLLPWFKNKNFKTQQQFDLLLAQYLNQRDLKNKLLNIDYDRFVEYLKNIEGITNIQKINDQVQKYISRYQIYISNPKKYILYFNQKLLFIEIFNKWVESIPELKIYFPNEETIEKVYDQKFLPFLNKKVTQLSRNDFIMLIKKFLSSRYFIESLFINQQSNGLECFKNYIFKKFHLSFENLKNYKQALDLIIQFQNDHDFWNNIWLQIKDQLIIDWCLNPLKNQLEERKFENVEDANKIRDEYIQKFLNSKKDQVFELMCLNDIQKEDVLHELRQYSKLITKDGYIIFQSLI